MVGLSPLSHNPSFFLGEIPPNYQVIIQVHFYGTFLGASPRLTIYDIYMFHLTLHELYFYFFYTIWNVSCCHYLDCRL